MTTIPLADDIPEQEWEFFKDTIRSLYLTENRNLEGMGGVRDEMRSSYNFHAT